METDRSHMTNKILNLTLEIIYLLTGENYVAFKFSDGLVASNLMKTQCPNVQPPSHSLRKNKKVQEVTSEIIELLTGEVPIRCPDGTVYFSMEGWEYLEGHKDLYEDGMMASQAALRSPDGSYSNHPESCPRPLYSRDSTQEHQEIPKKNQEKSQKEIKTQDIDEDVIYVRGDELCKEEEGPPEISTDPEHTRATQTDVKVEEEELNVNYVKIEEEEIPIIIDTDGQDSGYNPKKHDFFYPGAIDDEVIAQVLEKNPITPNLHPVLLSADLLSHSSTHGGSFSNHPTPINRQPNHSTGPVFMCSICGKCFAWKCSLVDHQRTHTGEKPYACTECGKCFSKKTKLTLHQRTHTGERPYGCTECGKCFTRRDHLIIHQRTHTGVKPYSCQDCGKSFSQRAFLIVHQRAHTGVKPYSCTECGKCFTGKAHLSVHQRTHTGEKPHCCSECGKTFTERSQLLRHRMSHDNLRQFLCPVCGRNFGSKSSLVRHQQLHTSGNLQAYSE